MMVGANYADHPGQTGGLADGVSVVLCQNINLNQHDKVSRNLLSPNHSPITFALTLLRSHTCAAPSRISEHSVVGKIMHALIGYVAEPIR
jgi:hypothetical protein